MYHTCAHDDGMGWVVPAPWMYQQIHKLFCVCVLHQISADPLEGNKYVCQISDDLAQRVAVNVNVNLGHYLQYAA